MTTDGTILKVQQADSAIDAPAAGYTRSFAGTDGQDHYKNSDGTTTVPYTGKAVASAHADPWFDVTAYGTVDKTGAVSSNTAFAACVAAMIASPRGGRMYVPAGVYLVNTGTIDFSASSNPFSIVGADRGLSVIVPNGTGDVIKFGGSDGCSVRDLAIFSSGATQTAGNAIHTNGCDDLLIDNVLFNNQFVDIFVDGTSIKVSMQRLVHTHGVNNGANSIGILVTNGLAGDTYIGPDVVMSDTGAVRRKACVEVTQCGHFEINQCNLTGSAQGLLIDPGAGLIVADGFINHSLFDSCTVNGVTLNAATATSTIKSLHFVNSWFAGTVTGAGQAGFLTAGTAGGILNGVDLVSCRALNNQTHGYQHGFGTDFRFVTCRASGNSSAASNASDGLNAAAAVSNWSVIGGKYGGTDGASTGGQQRWGINVVAGAGDFIGIELPDCQGNLTGPLSFNATGTHNNIQSVIGGLPKGVLAAILASTAALTAADTLIVSAPIPANAIQAVQGAPTMFRIRATGQYAGSASNVCNFRVRIGTAGTIADVAIATVTTAAGGTATVGFTVEILVTCRAANSATAATMGDGFCLGIPAAGVSPTNSVAVNINSTVANFISLTAGVAAITSNLTFHIASIECL